MHNFLIESLKRRLVIDLRLRMSFVGLSIWLDPNSFRAHLLPFRKYFEPEMNCFADDCWRWCWLPGRHIHSRQNALDLVKTLILRLIVQN